MNFVDWVYNIINNLKQPDLLIIYGYLIYLTAHAMLSGMANKKREKDPNEIAFNILQQTIGEAQPEIEPERVKNPAAVELGRLGGLKGGRARAEKLTADRRKEIASKAAKSRWSKDKNNK
jgi:hypothetical protein